MSFRWVSDCSPCHRQPTDRPWASHGQPTGSPWTSHSKPRAAQPQRKSTSGQQWPTRGLPTGAPWTSHGHPIGIPWASTISYVFISACTVFGVKSSNGEKGVGDVVAVVAAEPSAARTRSLTCDARNEQSLTDTALARSPAVREILVLSGSRGGIPRGGVRKHEDSGVRVSRW